MGSVVKKATDKHVTDALRQAQKLVDELKRLITIIEDRIDTGNIPFKE